MTNEKETSSAGLTPSDADALWNSLVALATGGKKSSPVLGRVKNAAAKVARAEGRKRERTSWKWTDEEVILIMHEDTCSCCGATFQWPNPAPLIKRTHPKLGTHYTAAEDRPGTDPEHEYYSLPQRVEYVFGNSQACHHCFGLEHAVEAGRKAAGATAEGAPTAETAEGEKL